MNRICVLGLGYIGLPTALIFANAGYRVTGVDINAEIVENLNKGILHFEEPGLAELFANAGENFHASTEIGEADVFLIAVPTPLNKAIRVSELGYVRKCAEMIFPHLRKGNLVILESTVSPGASEKLVIPLLEKNGVTRDEFWYAHCPERAIPGNTLHEMVYNDRIIGGFDDASALYAQKLYSSFVKGNIYLTDVKTAEFVKLIENTYRDVNIALANELAKIAEECGINIWEACSLANKHPRVNIHNPGPGVGGHCIAIDPWFLTEGAVASGIIHLARDINNSMPNYIIHMLRTMINGIKNPVITVFGVSYKGNVDDTRETPALKFIQLAENEGFTVKCYDPHVSEFQYTLYNLNNATEGSDCIVIITDHNEFTHIDPSNLEMRNKNVIDTRNIVKIEKWNDAGFRVKVLGCGIPR